MTKEAWNKFCGAGWKYGEEPSKRDCFEAGFKAGVNSGPDNLWEIIVNGKKFRCSRELASEWVGSENVSKMIREWQDKYDE